VELAHRQAADADVGAEQRARERIFAGRQVLPRGRDEELLEALSAEGARSDLARRHLDDGVDPLEAGEDDRRLLVPSIHALAAVHADLSQQPGEAATRQRATERSLEILRAMRGLRREPDAALAAALTAARIAVTDLMLFAGVDPEEARAATREQPREHRELEVRAPASAGKGLLASLRRRFRA
jgi:hypothetical protein